MLARWTRLVVRGRLAALAVWVVLLGAGVYAAGHLSPLVTSSFEVPGSDSERAQLLLERHFGDRSDGSFTVVFPVHHASDPVQKRRLQRRLDRAARAVPTGSAGPLREGAGVLFGEVGTRLDLQQAKGWTSQLRAALGDPGGPPALVTGQPAIQHDLDPVLARDLRRGEAIAIPVAALALLLVLGVSLAVLVPFAFAACTIATTLLLVYALAHVTPMQTYTENLVALLGLGLAVDYSLLVVHRFREELERGGSVEDAVVRTSVSAGRAALVSGTAVAIGLGLLALVPVPLVRSMGVAGLLVPLVSIAAVLTLQPALLSVLGRRGVARAVGGSGTGAESPDRGFWAALGRRVTRRPVPYLAGACALLAAAAAPLAWLSLTPASITGLPSSLESVAAYELLLVRAGPGLIAPIQVVVDSSRPGGAVAGPTRRALLRFQDVLFHEPQEEVYVVWGGRRQPYVDPTGRYARVLVAGRHEYGAPETQALVERIRGQWVPAARFPARDLVVAGGPPAQGVDFLSRTYGTFWWLVVAVLGLTYLVLLRAFRAVVLPAEAVLSNLLSVAAALGLLVVVFRFGVGHAVLGIERQPQIEGWVPIFLFAVMFGLSMDYEVFLVSRMRESWDRVPDNRRAIVHGLQRSGRIVTAAAVIMVAALAGFVAGDVAGLQELGVGLILAVVLDATVVRAWLVPSLMALVGERNWWLPVGVARALRLPRQRGRVASDAAPVSSRGGTGSPGG